MKRVLEITIEANANGCFDVGVYEPETGDWAPFEFPFSPDEHPEFNEAIGNEIYSWVSMLYDEMESEEEE